MASRIPTRAGPSERIIGKGKPMGRSRYQSGSIFVRGKKKRMYVARYYEPVIGRNGKPRRKRRGQTLGSVSKIGSKRAAQALLASILRPINLGVQKPQVMITFGEFVQQQWKRNYLHTFKLSTRVGYISLLNKDLLPYFERKILSEITPAQIQGFLTEKFRMGKSWSLVRNLRNLMRSILRTAVELNHVEENPAIKTKLPPRPLRRPMHHPTTEQVTTLLAEIMEPYRSMVLVAVLTGMRRGELFGLRWGAVDLERRVLEVRESVYNGHFSTPKTNSSNRRVPLSSPVWELLRNRKAKLNSAKADDLVFCSRSGTAIRPDNVLKRVIYPACDRLKIPRAGWHTFRRTHATLLNENGENPKTTQAILGHTNLETTMHHYIHAVPQTMFEAEERLAVSLMDPKGLKSKKEVSLKTEEGLWIQ